MPAQLRLLLSQVVYEHTNTLSIARNETVHYISADTKALLTDIYVWDFLIVRNINFR